MGRRSKATQKKKLEARRKRLLLHPHTAGLPQAHAHAVDAISHAHSTARVGVADVALAELDARQAEAEDASEPPLPSYPASEFGRFGGPAGRPAVSVAPMMAWTDHHYRHLVRLIERQWRCDQRNQQRGHHGTADDDNRDTCGTDDGASSGDGPGTPKGDAVRDHNAASAPLPVPLTSACPTATAAGRGAVDGVLLVTEMLEADRVVALSASDPASLAAMLSFDASQQPVAAQIGGGDPSVLAAAAARCAEAGYAEVNLNVGCPSSPVCGKGFGVSLMKEPARVAAIVAAVRAAVPADCLVTVKHRLGVDDFDSYAQLLRFVRRVAEPPASCQYFVVHARKAILGLSTAANRMVPPLRHDWVLRLAAHFPELRFELNGHVQSLAEARAWLARRVRPRRRPCAPPLRDSDSDNDSGRPAQHQHGSGDEHPDNSNDHNSSNGAAGSDSGDGDTDDAGSSGDRATPAAGGGGGSPGTVRLHGVMIGRAAWHTPWMFYTGTPGAGGGADGCSSDVSAATVPSLRARVAVGEAYCAYARAVLAAAEPAARRCQAFARGVYRPHANTNTFGGLSGVRVGGGGGGGGNAVGDSASASAAAAATPPTYCARGCKPVQTLSELRFRLTQPLLNLFNTSAPSRGPAPVAAASGAAALTPARSDNGAAAPTSSLPAPAAGAGAGTGAGAGRRREPSAAAAVGDDGDGHDDREASTMRRLRAAVLKAVKAHRLDAFPAGVFDVLLGELRAKVAATKEAARAAAAFWGAKPSAVV